MELSDAIALIEAAVYPKNSLAHWADLGCGSGLFTKALAGLLPQESIVHAVDKSPQIVPSRHHGVAIDFVQLDFTKDSLPWSDLDGILMANSLHYVKDKLSFLSRIKKHLKAQGEIIIIEYERRTGNQWVPFPIVISDLQQILGDLNFADVRKIGERRSVYGEFSIYACVGVLRS